MCVCVVCVRVACSTLASTLPFTLGQLPFDKSQLRYLCISSITRRVSYRFLIIRTAKAAVEIGQRWGRIGKGFPFPYAVSSVRALGVMTAFGIPYVVQWKDVCSEEPVQRRAASRPTNSDSSVQQMPHVRTGKQT